MKAVVTFTAMILLTAFTNWLLSNDIDFDDDWRE